MRSLPAGNIRVEIHGSVEDIVSAAASRLFDQLRGKGNSVIGLATGSTFIPFYSYIAAHFHAEGISFGKAVTFNLDEYFPISHSNRDSYHSYMEEHLFSLIDVDAANTHIPDGSTSDPEGEAKRYDEMIRRAGGIDLQFLGLGRNGHIGFNEPGTPFRSRTHLTALTQSTIDANSPLFSGGADVPHSALTMGIGTIMEARRIVLLAFGAQKAEAVRDALRLEVSENVPASALRRHPDAVFMLDEAAASLL